MESSERIRQAVQGLDNALLRQKAALESFNRTVEEFRVAVSAMSYVT